MVGKGEVGVKQSMAHQSPQPPVHCVRGHGDASLPALIGVTESQPMPILLPERAGGSEKRQGYCGE